MLDALLRIAEVLTHLVGGYALHKARAAKFRQVVLGRNWATPMPGGIPKHRATEWCCYRRPYVCSQQSLALSPKRKPVCFLYLSHAGRIISPTATMRTSSFVMLDAGSARCGSLAWRVADRVCYFCRFGPSRLRCFPGFLFALFVCKSFCRRFAALAAQRYRGGVLLFGHEPSITTVPAGEPNGQKVPIHWPISAGT
jgi:hypothetical protein